MIEMVKLFDLKGVVSVIQVTFHAKMAICPIHIHNGSLSYYQTKV